MNIPLPWGLALGILTGCTVVQVPEQPPAETMEVREEAPRVELGEAVLEWDVPTTRADGSCLRDLGGFAVSWGTDPDQLVHTQRIPLEELSCRGTGENTPCGEIQRCSFTVGDLAPSTWYFMLYAYDDELIPSEGSEVVQKTIEPRR